LNAYVKFKSEESVAAALKLNNEVLGERHLRVDRATPTLFDPKCTVFLGGLPFYADEEQLRVFFAEVRGASTVTNATCLLTSAYSHLLFIQYVVNNIMYLGTS
jgi:RNA recognition motif-containing protein